MALLGVFYELRNGFFRLLPCWLRMGDGWSMEMVLMDIKVQIVSIGRVSNASQVDRGAENQRKWQNWRPQCKNPKNSPPIVLQHSSTASRVTPIQFSPGFSFPLHFLHFFCSVRRQTTTETKTNQTGKMQFLLSPRPPHRNGKSFFLQNSTKNRLVGSRFTIFLLLRFLESDRTCIEGGWGAKQQNCVIFHRNARLDEREKCRAKVPPPPICNCPFPSTIHFPGAGKKSNKRKILRKWPEIV